MKHLKFLSYLSAVSVLLALLAGCLNSPHTSDLDTDAPKQKVYYTLFDTVSYIYSYAGDSQSVFESNCDGVYRILEDYNRLFDIYNEYPGISNLCTVNKSAGGDWIEVDKRLADFLMYAKELCRKTDGEMNIMMGAVLSLWHQSRQLALNDPSSAAIPSTEALSEAAKHISPDSLEIDYEHSAVRIADPLASIDVGAIGKGYATEMAAAYLWEAGAEGYALSIGGNLRTVGTKPDGAGWRTGIKDPAAPSTYASCITLSNTSCVTSGSYERYFTVDGERYHHIIDKDTLMPAIHFTSVTVITSHSGLADALSTALFCMKYEEGRALAEGFDDLQVLWITEDGTQYTTDGFSSLLSGIEADLGAK